MNKTTKILFNPKILLILSAFVLGLSVIRLFACDYEDFKHSYTIMNEQSAIHNMQIAEGYFKEQNFREAQIFFQKADQAYEAINFPDLNLRFRIKTGLLFSEILENPDLFLEKNIYIDGLRSLMTEN